jgi:hypothetical protein
LRSSACLGTYRLPFAKRPSIQPTAPAIRRAARGRWFTEAAADLRAPCAEAKAGPVARRACLAFSCPSEWPSPASAGLSGPLSVARAVSAPSGEMKPVATGFGAGSEAGKVSSTPLSTFASVVAPGFRSETQSPVSRSASCGSCRCPWRLLLRSIAGRWARTAGRSIRFE